MFELKLVYRKRNRRGMIIGITWLKQILELKKMNQRVILYLFDRQVFNEKDGLSRKEIADGLNIEIRNMTNDFNLLEGMGFIKSVKKINEETSRKLQYYYVDVEGLAPRSDVGYIDTVTTRISDGNIGERFYEPTINYDTHRQIDPDMAIDYN